VSRGSVNEANENQMGSVFARWALPAAKAEFYGEFYKEDFAGPFHKGPSSLVEKPDDLSAFSLGFQRVIRSTAAEIRVIRGELVAGETSHQERGQRGFDFPNPPYIHSELQQGHTLNGLILGSPEAYGGAGWRIGVDTYTAAGRTTFSLERALRFDYLFGGGSNDTALVHPDVVYAIRGEMLRFRGKMDYTLTVAPAIDLNRNLVPHHDVFNLMASVTVHGW